MRFQNSVKMHAGNMDSSQPVGRWAVVTGADTKSMTVKVTIQPEGVQTDWLPLVSSAVGGGWGMVHVPPVGTQVFCLPDAGDHNSYVVMGATWSAKNRPPAAVLQGEMWLVHSTGSAIKLTNDGHVKVTDASGCSLEFQNNGTATLTGNLMVTGNISDVNGTHGTIGSLRTAYDTHHHTGVQGGAGSTGITDIII